MDVADVVVPERGSELNPVEMDRGSGGTGGAAGTTALGRGDDEVDAERCEL